MYHDEDYCDDPQCGCHSDAKYHEQVTIDDPLKYTQEEYNYAIATLGDYHIDEMVVAA